MNIEHRIFCKTFLTSDNTIFVKGEYEKNQGVDYSQKPCADCATKYPSFYFKSLNKDWIMLNNMILLLMPFIIS